MICQQCGHERSSETEIAVCPACLLKSASDLSLTLSQSNPRFEAPTPEELQSALSGFAVHSLIGQGGMGAVYLCTQASLDRQVAMKILPLASANDDTLPERFQREARVVGKMHHPGIVSVFDAGEVEGYLYLVMQYVEGCTLRDLIQSGEISEDDVLGMMLQLCAAIQFAHDKGVVHRDIKPENVLVDQSGQLHIADFGIAKVLQGDATPIDLTPTNSGLGTLHYMAPEQRSNTNVDHRADIYALGVLFYEMLTGKIPTVDFVPPSRKRKLEKRIDSIIIKSLRESPENRYQHVSELKADIESVLEKHSLSLRTMLSAAAVVITTGVILMGIYQQFFPDVQQADKAAVHRSSTNPVNDSATIAPSTSPESPQRSFRLVSNGQFLGAKSSLSPVLGDFDNDGDLDLLFSGEGEAGNSVWLNDGQGQFENVPQPNLGVSGESCVVFDVDGDGNLDCIMASRQEFLTVYLGNGDGTFHIGQQISGSDEIPELVAGDLDGDGDQDLIRISGKWKGPGITRVYFNQDGTFHESQQHLGNVSSWAVAIADLNGDGSLDVFVTMSNLKWHQIWLNNGQGVFEQSDQDFGESKSRDVLLEDFDGDGDIDIFLVNDSPAHDLWLNNGTGDFVLSKSYPETQSGSCAAAIDFDLDGDLDLLIGHFNGFPDHVYLNDGNADFEKSDLSLGKTYTMACTSGDVNGDGRTDIVIANANDAPNRIWLNLPAKK